MKKPTAPIDLKGVMDLIHRSKYPLAPLYEAITNSLESISQRHLKHGKGEPGRVDVNLYFTGLLPETNELERIDIVDNGIGFDDENFDRFETLLDKSKGYNNRGSGRVQFLHRVERVEVVSHYKKGSQIYRRSFTYDNHNYISRDTDEPVADQTSTGSTVSLIGFALSGADKTYFDSLTVDELKNEIKNHYLLRLYLDKEKKQFAVPVITVAFFKQGKPKGTAAIKPQDIPAPLKSGKFSVFYVKVKNPKADDLDWVPVPKKAEELRWAHFRLPNTELQRNGVFLCSKNVPVKEMTFREIKKGESVEGHRFLTAVYGDVLDNEDFVSHSVDSFTFPVQKDTERLVKDDLFFDPTQTFLFFDNIEKGVDGIIPGIYKEIFDLQKLHEKNVDAIARAHGIPLDTARSANINLTDTEQQITDKIYRRQAEELSRENQKIKKLYDSLSQLNPADANYQEELQERSEELLSLIPQQNKEELSRYVIRRQMVTQVLRLILDNALDYQSDTHVPKGKTRKPRKDKEGLIHDLIFKRRNKTTSTLNDLWILNEEYVHFDGCSDLPISQITDDKGNKLLRSITDAELAKYGVKPERRPDVFLYAEEGKCILVELKEPGVDLSDYLNQMPKYCNIIANFAVQKIEKFYCYLIGENIQRIDLTGDYKTTVNGDWIKFDLPINSLKPGREDEPIASAQIEVIKLSSIYARAHRRNKSFADKLGISDLPDLKP